MRILSIMFLILAVLFGGMFYKNYEKKQAKLLAEQTAKIRLQNYTQDQAEISKYMELWESELRLASSTPRIALSNRVASLQEISRKGAALQLKTPCLDTTKIKLKQMADTYIEGLIAFMGNSEFVSARHLATANDLKSALVNDIAACKPTGVAPV